MKQGIIPGIKVDTGAKPLAGFPGETITEGLDGLRERLVEYRKLGALFAKWRAVIDIADGDPDAGTPIEANAHALARYAALCQENGIVPIVEPEVLMDGAHSHRALRGGHQPGAGDGVPRSCSRQRVLLEGIVLKPNMVISGKKAAQPRRPGGGRRGDAAHAAPSRAAGGARHRLPLRRAVAAGGDAAPGAHEQASATAALGADLQLRACAAGHRAQGLGRRGGQLRRRPEASSPSARKLNGLAAAGRYTAEMESQAA